MSKKDQDHPRLFTTSGGKQIELQPVPQLQVQRAKEGAERKAIELYGEAKKPTYTMPETDEVVEHDEITIADELATDEDKAAWAKYQGIHAQHQAYINQKVLDFWFYHGVKADPDADTSWEDTQRFFDIEIPTDPIARKIHYVQTELVFGSDDIEQIITRIMSLAGVREELIQSSLNSFRD